VGRFVAVLLAVVVVVELILVVGIAGALFWTGGRGSFVMGAAMLLVALVATVLAVRAMRPRR
jgi:hypothetical protein